MLIPVLNLDYPDILSSLGPFPKNLSDQMLAAIDRTITICLHSEAILVMDRRWGGSVHDQKIESSLAQQRGPTPTSRRRLSVRFVENPWQQALTYQDQSQLVFLVSDRDGLSRLGDLADHWLLLTSAGDPSDLIWPPCSRFIADRPHAVPHPVSQTAIHSSKYGEKIGYLLARTSAANRLQAIMQQGDCDLHLHTTASDGSDTPEQLLQRVLQAGLTCFAITDHDNLGSIERMRALLSQVHLSGQATSGPMPDFVPGVEISVEEACELHLLGYFPNGGCSRLEPFLEKQRRSRHQRNIDMMQRLQQLGYDLTLNDLAAAGELVVGRVQAALLLKQKGYVETTAEAFDKILGFGQPGYVERPRPGLGEAVQQIRLAGGVPVLAHPALYGWCDQVSPGWVPPMLVARLRHARNLGLVGVEAWHGEATDLQQQAVAAAGLLLGLLRTGGSDDHGQNKQHTHLFRKGHVFTPAKELLVTGALVAGRTPTDRPGWLVARRVKGQEGFWELPGGKVEPGESPEQALTREIQEELLVAAQIGALHTLLWHDYPADQTRQAFRVILACFETTLTANPQTLTAHDAWQFVTRDEALEMNLLPADFVLFQHMAD